MMHCIGGWWLRITACVSCLTAAEYMTDKAAEAGGVWLRATGWATQVTTEGSRSPRGGGCFHRSTSADSSSSTRSEECSSSAGSSERSACARLSPAACSAAASAGTAVTATTAIADMAVLTSRTPAASAADAAELPPSPSAGELPRRVLLRPIAGAPSSCFCANCCMLRQQCSRSSSTGSVSGGGGGGGRGSADGAASRVDAEVRDRVAGECRFGVARLLLPGTAVATGRPDDLPTATSAGPNAAATACALETLLQHCCTFCPRRCSYIAAHAGIYNCGKIAHNMQNMHTAQAQPCTDCLALSSPLLRDQVPPSALQGVWVAVCHEAPEPPGDWRSAGGASAARGCASMADAGQSACQAHCCGQALQGAGALQHLHALYMHPQWRRCHSTWGCQHLQSEPCY